MRTLGLTIALTFAVFHFGHNVDAGEALPNVSALPVGFRYCPAPGADNSDFNCSYYAIDAQTGQMSRYVDGQPKMDLEPIDTEEKLLFVAPTVDVENKYVPYPGAAPQQHPREFAGSDHGYAPGRGPVMRRPAPQPMMGQMGQQMGQVRQQQPMYAQPQPQPMQGQQQHYAQNQNTVQKKDKRPGKKRLLR